MIGKEKGRCKNSQILGVSPGLVVMGDGSRSKGSGSESQCCILHGHFFTLIYCKKLYCLLEKTENKTKKRPGWPIFFTKNSQIKT